MVVHLMEGLPLGLDRISHVADWLKINKRRDCFS